MISNPDSDLGKSNAPQRIIQMIHLKISEAWIRCIKNCSEADTAVFVIVLSRIVKLNRWMISDLRPFNNL